MYVPTIGIGCVYFHVHNLVWLELLIRVIIVLADFNISYHKNSRENIVFFLDKVTECVTISMIVA